ncbi:DsbA family protein [Thalassospira sp.]|uniref:DsbA family protein n=1 Tax=Thalassospira sp. TaxID=1912094 RepID=UPI001B0A419F|nr:DsbA family protein [Thalassospira sp.]MBO6773825.1 DsbA family protein [Thalassospira sp.]
MNRRSFIVQIGIAILGIFFFGMYLYQPLNKERVDVAPVANAADLVRGHSPIFGPEDAPVTIVEFFDPACESCRAFHPIVKDIMATYPNEVRVVLRYAAFHPPSEQAVRLLEAARLQGKLEPVLERLLETQPRWAPHGRTPESVWNLLDGTGLDIARAQRDSLMPHIVGVLNQDATDIKSFDVKGTPTFFVNGKPLKAFGEQPLRDLVKTEVEAL